MIHRAFQIAFTSVALLATQGFTFAQTYPSRPVVMVVPFAAGGAFDVMGRILAVRMSELLGQQVVVENTTGAGGIVGTMRVMNAAPDGYTFLFGSVGTHAYNPTMYKNIRYNAATDFAPVTLFADQPMTLSARKDFPANTMPEFAAHLKANAVKLQYGSAGAGSTTHLACSLVNSTIGVNVTHVPYRGSAPASNDLIGGQIDYMCNNIGSATPLIKGGKVKAIANLSGTRSPLMPELATAREQGLTDLEISTWNAIFLPKGTPAAIVKRLGDVTNEAMDTPATKARMLDIGVDGIARERRSPEYLAKFVVDEIARWAGPIKDAGLQVD
jgi:tripartite-type tricarboxylate transporter receptor subunit TctC